MPEANKIKQDEVMVDLDTSGPDTEVNLPEEEVKQVAENTEQETVKEETAEPEKVETVKLFRRTLQLFLNLEKFLSKIFLHRTHQKKRGC